MWADESYQLSAAYWGNNAAPHLQALYLREYYNPKEIGAFKMTFSQQMRNGCGWGNSEKLGREFQSSESSEIFNNVIKPAGIRHCVEATICKDGKGLGSLILNRAADEKPFSDAEETRLRSLILTLHMALGGARDLRGQLTHSGEAGMFIVNHQNKIVQCCPNAKRLMQLAAHPEPTQHTFSPDSPRVKLLCANLRGILHGGAAPCLSFGSVTLGRILVERISSEC